MGGRLDSELLALLRLYSCGLEYLAKKGLGFRGYLGVYGGYIRSLGLPNIGVPFWWSP